MVQVKDMQAPKRYSMWTKEGVNLATKRMDATKIDAMGKSITTFSTPTLWQCKDGTVIEQGVDGRGSWLYCQWDNIFDALNYKEESWGNVKHENW